MNTFFVIFHAYDTPDSNQTPRYVIGYVLYMLDFLIQTIILLATFIYSFYLYARLALFLKPESEEPEPGNEELGNIGSLQQEDDEYFADNQNNQDGDVAASAFERKRGIIRRGFKSKYLTFNLQFVYMLVTLTLRTGTYIGLRLVSAEKIFDWVRIKPSVIYLTFCTDFMILFGVMYFIYQAAPLKEQY